MENYFQQSCLHKRSIRFSSSLSFEKPFLFSFVDAIRNYYGSTIAIYFAFLEYYTIALVPLVLLVFLFSLINLDELWYNLIFALINVLWGTLFLEFWKRNCATMTHNWGTLKQSLGNIRPDLFLIEISFCSFDICVYFPLVSVVLPL